MSYLQVRQDPTLGYFSSGSNCGCSKCSRLGEPPVAQPTGPIFRFECAPGCAPNAAGQCRAVLRQGIREAIRLSSNAASKLEANPRDADTIRHFLRLFGHRPDRPVPWANNTESGATIAHRLRKVAEALQGRGTLYRCVPCGTSTVLECPLDAPTIACPMNAQAVPPNTIELCPRFWEQSAAWRAGVLIHEMLHLLYLEFLHHGDPERRRDNAHCIEAFVLLANGITPDRCDICRCRRRAA